MAKVMINYLFKIFISLLILTFNFSSVNAMPTTNSLADCVVVTHCVRVDWNVDDVDSSFDKAKEIIKNTKRTKIVEESENYIHAEATSRIMRYVDDLEIMSNPNESILQIRSESRLGIGDMGVNRKRVINLLNLL